MCEISSGQAGGGDQQQQGHLLHSSDNFNEFVILLMGQHKYAVTLSNDCPTCTPAGLRKRSRYGMRGHEVRAW